MLNDKTPDFRIAEMKLLKKVADRTWETGVSAAESAGQCHTLGLNRELYADMILTLVEDGYLYTTSRPIMIGVNAYLRSHDLAEHNYTAKKLLDSDDYHDMTVTYRGLRRIEELRDRLRQDRILEKFGILLDGRYIVSDLIDFLERAKDEPVSMLLADVDDFKRFNTEFGYRAGDAVLRRVFQTVLQAIGARGEVYRRGGEEIVVLLPYCSQTVGQEIGQLICERVIGDRVSWEGSELNVTVSVGIAGTPPHDRDGPALESQAENGLRQAKKAGKNRVVVA